MVFKKAQKWNPNKVKSFYIEDVMDIIFLYADSLQTIKSYFGQGLISLSRKYNIKQASGYYSPPYIQICSNNKDLDVKMS